MSKLTTRETELIAALERADIEIAELKNELATAQEENEERFAIIKMQDRRIFKLEEENRDLHAKLDVLHEAPVALRAERKD